MSFLWEAATGVITEASDAEIDALEESAVRAALARVRRAPRLAVVAAPVPQAKPATRPVFGAVSQRNLI